MPWFFYLLACDGDPEFALIIGGICIAGGIYFDIDRVQRLIQRRREELTEGVFPGLTSTWRKSKLLVLLFIYGTADQDI